MQSSRSFGKAPEVVGMVWRDGKEVTALGTSSSGGAKQQSTVFVLFRQLINLVFVMKINLFPSRIIAQ